MHRQNHLVCALALALVVRSAWAAPPPPPASLNNCQNAIKTATKQFVTKKVMAIGACLQAVSTQVVKKNAAVGSAAASSCATQFRKLNDSRGLDKQLSDKLAAAIVKKCAPGQPNVTHTLADIIGAGAGVPQPLNADNLNAWCSHSGGDGSIDTLQEWIDCLTAAAECAVDSTIASQYPRVLEWLNLLKPAMQALSPPVADPTKITDAVAGLDAVKAEIDGPNNDNLVSIQCGGPGSFAQRFTDNGNGTVTDNQTKLVWEKKVAGSSCTHCLNDLYSWSNSGVVPDGTAFTDFLYKLNGGTSPDGVATSGCFAGHCDWRLPTIEELRGILLSSFPCSTNPCIDPVFGPTQSSNYWSATTFAPGPGGVWVVFFGNGQVVVDNKTTVFYVRAVRSGL